jgi:hypothetical protein
MMTDRNKAIIIAYDKGYRVDSEGNVYGSTNKKVNPWLDNGYFAFSVNVDGESIKVRVHRLLAYQLFKDKIFEEDIQVRHLDGNSTNNTPSNLAIGSASDNSFDRPKAQRIDSALNAASYKIKYDWDKIREDSLKGMSYKDLMKKYKITSKGTLSYHLNQKNQKNLYNSTLTSY